MKTLAWVILGASNVESMKSGSVLVEFSAGSLIIATGFIILISQLIRIKRSYF